MRTATPELCYTVNMDSNRHIWRMWANKLQKWGLANWTASFIEAAGPLTLIAAQLVYITQPFISKALPEEHWQALTELLEDSGKTHHFAAYLREGDLS